MCCSIRMRKKCLEALLSVLIPACFIVTNVYAQDDLMKLVREVQANTQRTYDYIQSVQYSGYSRFQVYVGWNALGLNIVPITEEYHFNGIWIKPDSVRLEIVALRMATPDTGSQAMSISNQPPLPNPFQFSYDASALGTDKEDERKREIEKKKRESEVRRGIIVEAKTEKKEDKREVSVSVGASMDPYWPLFPFAVGADSIYNYDLVSEIGFGYKKIYEIYVTPKYVNIPGVIGTFQVDPDEKVVVGSDVVFNEAAHFLQKEIDSEDIPLLIRPFMSVDEDHKTKTKMALVYSTYWMPETIQEDFFAKIWGIKAKVSREFHFTSYLINEELPDTSVFADKKITMKRDPTLEEEVFKDWQSPTKIPEGMEDKLIREAEKVFAALDLNDEIFDSELMAKEAFKTRFGDRGQKYFNIAQQYSDNIRYNRVEGLRIDYGLTFSNSLVTNNALIVKGGYGFKDERWKGEASMLHYIDKRRKFFIESNLYYTIAFDENRKLFSTTKNTLSSLFFNTDYRDYYYKNGGSMGIGYRVTDNVAIKVMGVSHTEESANNHTRFSIFRYNTPFRLNPEIIGGEFRGLRASLLYRTGGINADILAEYSDKKTLHSDFSHASALANLRWNYKFDDLHSIYFTLSGAASDHSLPPQRWFDFGGKSFLNYNGNLRGAGYKAFTGDRMAYGVFEFQRYGKHMFDLSRDDNRWDNYLRILKFTVWGGFGWSELSEKNRLYTAGIRTPMRTTDGVYHEFGIGISDRFNFFRLDFIRNSTSKNNILIGFNFLR